MLQIRCRSAHHRLRQRKMAPQIVTEGHKPQRIRIGTRKCVISRPCNLSHGRLHISAEYTSGVTGSDTQSSRDRTRQALPTQAWRLCFGVVGRAAVSPRGAINGSNGGGPRFALAFGSSCAHRLRAQVEWAGAEWGYRNGARLVSPEWDEGVRFRSADVAHISLSSAVR